jgi:hypothetical protein
LEAPEPARAGWAALKWILSGPICWASHCCHGSFETQAYYIYIYIYIYPCFFSISIKCFPFTESCIYPSFFLCILVSDKGLLRILISRQDWKEFHAAQDRRRLPVLSHSKIQIPFLCILPKRVVIEHFFFRGSLVYVELLDNPRYRKFLNRAFPWIRYVRVGIKHVFMTPVIAAAKDNRS